ncbi:hypothetical protein CSUI_000009, partial [Cystoisospora suis]
RGQTETTLEVNRNAVAPIVAPCQCWHAGWCAIFCDRAGFGARRGVGAPQVNWHSLTGVFLSWSKVDPRKLAHGPPAREDAIFCQGYCTNCQALRFDRCCCSCCWRACDLAIPTTPLEEIPRAALMPKLDHWLIREGLNVA